MQHARINKGGKLRLATYDVFGLTAHAIPDRIKRLEPCTLRIDLMHRHLLLPHFYCSRHTIIARRLDDCPNAVAPMVNLGPDVRKRAKSLKRHIFFTRSKSTPGVRALAQGGREFWEFKPPGERNYDRRDKKSSTPAL